MTIEKLLFELNASSNIIFTKDAVTKRPLNSLELNFEGQFGANLGSNAVFISKIKSFGHFSKSKIRRSKLTNFP